MADGVRGMVNVRNTAYKQVLSFVRQDEDSRVFCVLNFSDQDQTITLGPGPHHGEWREHFSGTELAIDADTHLTIEPFGYRIFVG